MKRLIRALALVLLCKSVFAAPARIENIAFSSQGVTLHGSIAFPADQPARAAVVFVHGSGKQARNLGLAELFASRGIAALVYDKRGAGQSGGEYEEKQSVSGMNVALLADDAAAALEALANHAALKDVPAGFAGISQAGWIAPLAATKTKQAKFLLLWSGPVCKVSEEDIYSKFTADQDGADRPLYAAALAARTDPYLWPDFLGRDTDSAEDLGKLTIPGLFIFGGRDGSIPVDLSLQKLHALQVAGHAYDYTVFLGLGHNNIDPSFDVAIKWINVNVPAPK
jgi:uncharacterized protein